MEYTYKTTTHGRAVMAACMALEKPFKVTRVAFGGGKIGEDVNLADVHELLEYVTDGAVSERRHKDNRFFLTIQFANAVHPDVQTFMLSEFIVYVADPETGKDTDLLYGTLGDYRQPVPAYNPAYGPSVFDFPLTIILSDEINVSVSAPYGIATWEDIRRVSENLAARQRDITIPATGWVNSGNSRYPKRVDIPAEGVTRDMIPSLTVLEDGEVTAIDCGIAPRVQTLDGAVRVFAAYIPTQPIPASLVLQGDSSGFILGSCDSGTVTMPVATAQRAGAVKPGNGLNVEPDGTLSVNPEKVMTTEDLVDEAEVAESVANILNGDEAK